MITIKWSSIQSSIFLLTICIKAQHWFADIKPWLIFSNKYYIRELSTDGQNYRRVAQGFDSVVALDFDYREDRLYFTDVKAKRIFRMHLNGTGKEEIVKHYVAGAEGLAIDWIGR